MNYVFGFVFEWQYFRGSHCWYSAMIIILLSKDKGRIIILISQPSRMLYVWTSRRHPPLVEATYLSRSARQGIATSEWLEQWRIGEEHSPKWSTSVIGAWPARLTKRLFVAQSPHDQGRMQRRFRYRRLSQPQSVVVVRPQQRSGSPADRGERKKAERRIPLWRETSTSPTNLVAVGWHDKSIAFKGPDWMVV